MKSLECCPMQRAEIDRIEYKGYNATARHTGTCYEIFVDLETSSNLFYRDTMVEGIRDFEAIVDEFIAKRRD